MSTEMIVTEDGKPTVAAQWEPAGEFKVLRLVCYPEADTSDERIMYRIIGLNDMADRNISDLAQLMTLGSGKARHER